MIIRCFSACKRYQRCPKCQMILLPLYIYIYKAMAIEVLVMKWFSSGERGERMKKKPTGHFASNKGKVGCGGGGPGCLWCGQQPSTAPIEPNAGGPQQPKLSRVTTTRFRCSVGPSLRYWANESETMAFPVHHFLSLSYWLIKSVLLCPPALSFI